MREIKFRVWSGERMTNSQLFSVSMKGQLWFDSGSSGVVGVDDRPLMQYTGLKDKNENDVFEGDIVRYSNKLENGLAEVKWEKGGFCFWWIEQKTSSPSLYDHAGYFGCASELEVIGNIYENPELLETE